ncbi:MAG: hypothetical protein HC814_08210, partial [Rhodobacteraceae bacterium]|nr:hypothetical protein [Paracoccaceae bacterium]
MGNTNTYSGGTRITGGTLTVNGDFGLGTAPVLATPGHLVITNGTLRLTQSTTLDSNRGMWIGFTNNGAAIWSAGISVDAGATVTYNGIISNHTANLSVNDANPIRVGRFIKDGAGVLELGGDNRYNGLTVVRGGGTLSIGADGNLGVAPGSATVAHLQLSNGTLRATANFTLDANRGIRLATASGGKIEVTGANTMTYNGVMDGTAPFSKTGTGTLDVSAAGVFGSVTALNIDEGTLRLTGSGASTFVNDTASVRMGGGTLALNDTGA